MNVLNRALISLKRQWVKSVILLITVFILGFLLTVTTIVRNAILQTEHNLWSNMPRIAAINLDFEVSQEITREALETGDESLLDVSGVSPEIIREIGLLPYVESFNYTFRHLLWNSELQSYEDSFNVWDEPAFWEVQGAYNHNLLDLDEGVIQIVAGRTFEEADMEGIGQTVLISQELAEVNNLTIGSTITLESRLYDDVEDVYENQDWLNIDRIVEMKTFELEIIGLFEVMVEIPEEDQFEEIIIDGTTITVETLEVVLLRQLQNQMYLPISVIDASPSFDFERVSQLEAFGVEAQFLLYDPLDMPDFIYEANLLLSGWWRMADLSGNFRRITASMETMQWIADMVFWGGTSASIVILGLCMMLFLYDRKQEIGIYLALGEKRKVIIIQVLSEVLLIAAISLSLSILLGNIATSNLTHRLLEQDIVRQIESGENQFWGINNLARHNSGEMGVEEMMANFEITLEGMAIVFVLTVGLITVLFSTLVSLSFVVKLSPKKILM